MNLLPKKLADAHHALNTLKEALNVDYSVLVRDASIQRFEYTVEAVWKCLQVYLRETLFLQQDDGRASCRNGFSIRRA